MIILKLSNLVGDSKIEGKDGWISLSACAFSISRQLEESAKGGTADINLGVADPGPMSVSKTLDAGSAGMFKQSITGASVPKAEIEFITIMNGKAEVYLRYKLDNPTVASWRLAANEDDTPTEEAMIWYERILMESFFFDEKGKKAGSHSAGWDRVKKVEWSG